MDCNDLDETKHGSQVKQKLHKTSLGGSRPQLKIENASVTP